MRLRRDVLREPRRLRLPHVLPRGSRLEEVAGDLGTTLADLRALVQAATPAAPPG